MAKKLTIKQKAFAKETATTLNPTEAVRRIYDLGSKGGSKEKKQLEQTARAIASENLTKPNIVLSINKELEAQGITRQERIKILKDLLYGKDKRVILQALDMSFKLSDDYPAQKNKIIGLFESIRSKE